MLCREPGRPSSSQALTSLQGRRAWPDSSRRQAPASPVPLPGLRHLERGEGQGTVLPSNRPRAPAPGGAPHTGRAPGARQRPSPAAPARGCRGRRVLPCPAAAPPAPPRRPQLPPHPDPPRLRPLSRRRRHPLRPPTPPRSPPPGRIPASRRPVGPARRRRGSGPQPAPPLSATPGRPDPAQPAPSPSRPRPGLTAPPAAPVCFVSSRSSERADSGDRPEPVTHFRKPADEPT